MERQWLGRTCAAAVGARARLRQAGGLAEYAAGEIAIALFDRGMMVELVASVQTVRPGAAAAGEPALDRHRRDAGGVGGIGARASRSGERRARIGEREGGAGVVDPAARDGRRRRAVAGGVGRHGAQVVQAVGDRRGGSSCSRTGHGGRAARGRPRARAGGRRARTAARRCPTPASVAAPASAAAPARSEPGSRHRDGGGSGVVDPRRDRRRRDAEARGVGRDRARLVAAVGRPASCRPPQLNGAAVARRRRPRRRRRRPAPGSARDATPACVGRRRLDRRPARGSPRRVRER